MDSHRGSMLPPDLREKASQSRGAPGGIGGRAHENKEAAASRATAMGIAPEPESSEAAEEAPEIHPEVEATVCSRCKYEVQKEWEFCSACGKEMGRQGPAKTLGIEFGEQDVEDYLFKGFITRPLKFMGSHTITVRSSMASDLKHIDNYLMNGAWRKPKDKEKASNHDISEGLLRHLNQLCVTAANLLMIDGTSLGETIEARVAYLSEKGSAFVDMATNRVVLFNQAVTRFLEAKNSISGS